MKKDWPLTVFVVIVGVQDGKITEDGSGVTEYRNMQEAAQVFPELDPIGGSKNFTYAYLLPRTDALNFQTRKAHELSKQN